MFTFIRVVLAFPHAPLHPLLSNGRTLSGWGSPALSFSKLHKYRHKRLFGRSGLRIHPIDRPPEGVPSSLFTFQPHQKITKTGDDREDGGYKDANTTVAPLEVGLIEDSELEDVSGLLVDAFPADMILKDGEFSDIENVIIGAPLDMTNRYLRGVAYYEALYALKSRCGERLTRGDFALTSEALILAVRNPTALARRGDTHGRIIAVVELTLRQPNGSLPTNWPFRLPWRPAVPAKEWEPYMCNLAVEKDYRGQGLGKHLVRLCEYVAKNHWSYERLYLHVNLDDPVAMRLYSSMGYKSMEQYDAPLWMRRFLGMPTIRYQVKQFKGRWNAP